MLIFYIAFYNVGRTKGMFVVEKSYSLKCIHFIERFTLGLFHIFYAKIFINIFGNNNSPFTESSQ